MGKIVMPKNSALLNEIESVLKIYYEAGTWIPNDEYKTKLKDMIGDDQYSSSYTKKAQITSYFGFTIWEDIHNPQSRRRITDSGKQMYEAIKSNDTAQVQAVLMKALETVKFGRNNYGCPDSNSDVEPPALYIRAILDLGYLTYREFAFMLWKLEDLGANYTDTLAELRSLRSSGMVELGEEANKYADCKPIMILARWGFLTEDESDSTGGKHIIIVPEVLEKYETRLRNLKIYNIDMDCDEPIVDYTSTNNFKEHMELQSTVNYSDIGCNIILYGVPGCGKSHKIKTEYCDDEAYMERVVFHPDYTYSDFVGQILPQNIDGHISYPFIPGPFTRILKKAVDDENNSYYLVIEELNRGNAPAIFGEVFQLLDRIDGISEYGINNADIALSVYGDTTHQVKLPRNLFILATMNTADQNVFTLDTAFKRRWRMRSITNDVSLCFYAGNKICETSVTWASFLTKVNEIIVDLGEGNIGSEDKRLGAFFLQPRELNDIDMFSEKVLMYLWNDAFKYNHEKVFRPDYRTLDQLINDFKRIKFDVFNAQFETTGFEDESIEDGDNIAVTPEQYLEGKTEASLKLYNQLIDEFNKTGNEYVLGAVNNYISLKAPSRKIVAEIHLQKSNVKLLVKEPVSSQYRIGRLLPESYRWTKNYEIIFDESTVISDVIGAICDSYDQVNG